MMLVSVPEIFCILTSMLLFEPIISDCLLILNITEADYKVNTVELM